MLRLHGVLETHGRDRETGAPVISKHLLQKVLENPNAVKRRLTISADYQAAQHEELLKNARNALVENKELQRDNAWLEQETEKLQATIDELQSPDGLKETAIQFLKSHIHPQTGFFEFNKKSSFSSNVRPFVHPSYVGVLGGYSAEFKIGWSSFSNKTASLRSTQACGEAAFEAFTGVSAKDAGLRLPVRKSTTEWKKALADMKLEKSTEEIRITNCPFGAICDGSERGKKEVFPIMLYYWSSIENGPVLRLVDVCDLRNDKTAFSMAVRLAHCVLKQLELPRHMWKFATSGASAVSIAFRLLVSFC
jgi:hypothetical protein